VNTEVTVKFGFAIERQRTEFALDFVVGSSVLVKVGFSQENPATLLTHMACMNHSVFSLGIKVVELFVTVVTLHHPGMLSDIKNMNMLNKNKPSAVKDLKIVNFV